jgi:hypothetical protein
MGRIFKGQSALTIRLTVGQDITGATSLKIKYKKPSGLEGEWTAVEVDATEGTIGYTMADGDQLNEVGKWIFWAYVTFSDGKAAPGEPVEKWIYPEGE